MKFINILSLLILLQSCVCAYRTGDYETQYAYLKNLSLKQDTFSESDYYIIFLVDAKHFDYSNSQTFLKTFVKNPSGSKECSFGHAWIVLKGKDFIIEGGHSGENGIIKPRYVEGINSLILQKDDNPVRYLWESLEDGFFQYGNGDHAPTFAAKIDLTKDEFENILTFIKCYPYKNYSLTSRQCVSFVHQIAAIIDIALETELSLPLEKNLKIGKQTFILWNDPKYSVITFSSPEVLERSLIKLVLLGKAQNALGWYKNPKKEETLLKKIKSFPFRIQRYLSI